MNNNSQENKVTAIYIDEIGDNVIFYDTLFIYIQKYTIYTIPDYEEYCDHEVSKKEEA